MIFFVHFARSGFLFEIVCVFSHFFLVLKRFSQKENQFLFNMPKPRKYSVLRLLFRFFPDILNARAGNLIVFVQKSKIF
jgi:hypothetical protein